MKKKSVYFFILLSYLSVLEAELTQARSYISPGCEGRIVHTSYDSSLINAGAPSNFIEFETTSTSIIEYDSQGMTNFMIRKCEVKDDIDEELEEEFEGEALKAIVDENGFVEYPADMEKAERAFKRALRKMHRLQPI
jgi:hypothetical protein